MSGIEDYHGGYAKVPRGTEVDRVMMKRQALSKVLSALENVEDHVDIRLLDKAEVQSVIVMTKYVKEMLSR